MTEIILSEKPLCRLIHGDCMEFMAGLGENAYDLAVVDPPYGIGEANEKKCNQDIIRKKSIRAVIGIRRHQIKCILSC